MYLIFIKAQHFEGDRGEKERERDAKKDTAGQNGVHIGVEQRVGGWQGEKEKKTNRNTEGQRLEGEGAQKLRVEE